MNPEGSPSGRLQAPVGRALEGDMGTPVAPPTPTPALFHILVIEKSVTTFVTMMFFL